MTKVEKCFCAFCKNERTKDTKKHVGIREVLGAMVFASLLSMIFWQGIEPQAILFFSCLLGIFEYAIHLKWRLSVSCKYCGFDPILYKKNPELACQKVVAFMSERRKDPRYYLSRKTYDKLAVRKEGKKEELATLEKALSPEEVLSTRNTTNLPPSEAGVLTSSAIAKEIQEIQEMRPL